MTRSGCLLDTGPLVALVDRSDDRHEQAKMIFEALESPFLTCESVISESIFLLREVRPAGPDAILSLGKEGYYQIGMTLKDNFDPIREIIIKYKEHSVSLADASLIRCAEIYKEARILTFDSDFEFYRWGRNKRFEIIGGV